MTKFEQLGSTEEIDGVMDLLDDSGIFYDCTLEEFIEWLKFED